MNIEILPEPELEFGSGKHVDIRFGLMRYKPFDFQDPRVPRDIKLGIVGTNETIQGLSGWLDKCRSGIAAKQSRQPNLFPLFPGYGGDTPLPTPLTLSNQTQRSIRNNEFEKLTRIADKNEGVREAVRVFLEEIEYLSQNSSVDVIMCALPDVLLDYMEDEGRAEDENKFGKIDFRDLLKAQVMTLNMHTQVILPSTYDEAKRRRQKKRKSKFRSTQDEATRAWNLYTALYYKGKGTPWRLIRDASQLTTCYVGVSFYRTTEGDTLETSIAQVFNERGDGIIVRGGAARISKDDRQPHLSAQDAQELLFRALETYRKEHGTLPARVVLHKSSNYNSEELDGFRKALEEQRITTFDLTTVGITDFRLFRDAEYPPLRGTYITLDAKRQILYTRGSVDFFSTYPGMYIPNPLEIRCFEIEQTPKYLAQEIMGLSKMNWNKTQFDGADPITLWASRKVGSVLRYVEPNGVVQPRYSFYM
jgi:hypothetical protein